MKDDELGEIDESKEIGLNEADEADKRHTELIRAIAENVAVKSTTEHNGLFWFGIVALSVNFVVAVVAAIFGCPCKNINDKSCAEWVMLAISIIAALVSYSFSICDLYVSKKVKRKTNNDKAQTNNSTPTMSLLEIQKDTDRIKQSAKHSRFLQMFAIEFMIFAAVFAIIAIII